MSERIIKNYDPTNHKIDIDFLYNTNDWDLIELNYTLDKDKLYQWWKTIEEEFSFMKFNFDDNSERLDISESKQLVEWGLCGYYCGPIDGITLAWPRERYEPLPPPQQANLDLFPEVNRDTFIDDAKILSKFKFGYFKDMIEILGDDSFRQAVITTHHPGMYIRQHIDSKVLKLHIPLETNENALFHFGKDKERNYHMQLGKIYILNTGDWHGTTNESSEKRSHMITRITKSHISKIIGMVNA